ncbi:MAG: phytoene desaturase family protein [Planctomycetota bacterium]
MNGDSNGTIGVIGAGLGGLAAACTLAARGYRVEVFEKNDWIGGKDIELRAEGFRFDMGPTILTVPRVFERVFQEAGRVMSEYLDLVKLDPQWRCFFEDDTVLDLVESPETMADNLQALDPTGALSRGYREFVEHARRLADISDRYFFWQPVDTIGDMLDFSGMLDAKVLGDLWAMRMWDTVSGTVRGYLPDPRAAQLAEHFVQYIGSSPFQAPAILCGIAGMQVDEGIWYPRGGTRAVPVALGKLAESLGVTVHTGRRVTRILVRQGRVVGLETDDRQQHRLAAVVSNMDTVRTHRELIGPERTYPFLHRRGYEPACSGVVLYLGLSRRYDHLQHHNFVFSRDPHEEFDAIYNRGVPAPDPTCYLAAPSITEPDVAPEGGEALYVLVHTPHLRPEHDWSTDLASYRNVIVDKLRHTGGMTDIEDRIVFESALTPVDIRDRYLTLDGAIYGLASHGRLTGAIKPGNRSPDFKGLYLAGGSAHPGAGMPMAGMSGWIAADTLDKDGLVVK